MIKRTVLLITLLLGGIGLILAQGNSEKPLPPDPSVRTGKLKSGLTYYIQKNTEPMDRVVMYLAVKAGSMQEEEHQRGLAHYLEHMAFKGTVNFSENALLDYLQKEGVRFGADINAYTGFEETVYMLPVPTDKPEVVQQGLKILRDWAGNILMEQKDLDAERGVILAEKLQRGGVGERIQEKTLPVLLNNSRYIDRLPIGTEAVLHNFKRQDIVQFYNDWYRPDLQAVIIVGDIDVQAMEAHVKRLFGDMKGPQKRKERVSYKVPLPGHKQFLAVTDAEVPQAAIQLIHKRKEESFTYTESAIRASLVRGLAGSLISGRLSEASRKPNPPFQSVGTQSGSPMAGMNMFSLVISPYKDRLEEGFVAGMTEVERIKQHGFSVGELERARIRLVSGLEAYLRELDKRSSTQLADALKGSFLKGRPHAPAPEISVALQQRLLPGITLAEVNAQVAVLLDDTNRDIIIVAPEAELAALPDESTVNNWLAQVGRMNLDPYVEEEIGASLLAEVPTAGTIIAERALSELDATEWTLSNGAKVVYKTTDFKNDEILMFAASAGGTSLYPDSLFESASTGANMVAGFGVGSYDNIQLPKVLTGKQLGLRPNIGERNESLTGSSSPGDLPTAMELLHLYFTAPRKDTALFNTTIDRAEQGLANKYANPIAILQDTVAALMGGYHPRRRPFTKDRLAAINLDRALDIYKERFADAGDFTFYFVGNVNPDTLRPLVEQYIASLPAKGVAETAKDLGIRVPQGQIEKTVYGGVDDKATVIITLHGSRDTSPEEAMKLNALGEIAQYRLLDRLRLQEGGVYSPSVRMNLMHAPVSTYGLSIQFQCMPEDVEKLVAATHEELIKLRTEGILADDLTKFKAEYLRKQEVDVRTNGFWLNYLYAVEEGTKQVDEIEQLPGRVEALTAADLKEAANRYLHGKDVIKVVMLPEAMRNN